MEGSEYEVKEVEVEVGEWCGTCSFLDQQE